MAVQVNATDLMRNRNYYQMRVVADHEVIKVARFGYPEFVMMPLDEARSRGIDLRSATRSSFSSFSWLEFQQDTRKVHVITVWGRDSYAIVKL